MFVVKAVLKGVGETLFLRYNLMGDAQKVYANMKNRQRWSEAESEEKPVTEEFTDDYGVSALVPAYGVIFAQMINLEKWVEGDAKSNVRSQIALQKEVNRASQAGPIITPPMGNGAFRQ